MVERLWEFMAWIFWGYRSRAMGLEETPHSWRGSLDDTTYWNYVGVFEITPD